MLIPDKSVTGSRASRPKAEKNNPAQVGSPMKGDLIDLKVSEGDIVEKGQVLAVISAMKMEMAVQSLMSGKVKKVLVAKGDKVEGQDCLVELEE